MKNEISNSVGRVGIIVSVLISSSCVEQNTLAKLPEITETTPIASLTPEITPTDHIVVFSTPTETPVPTEEVIEKRANFDTSSFRISVDELIMGVKVKGSLITDSSLKSYISEVTLPTNILREYLLKCLFGGWKKNGIKVPTDITDDKKLFEYFVSALINAQNTNSDLAWESVEFTTYSDNLGKNIRIRPFSESETFNESVNINNFSVILVNPNRVDNLVDFGLSYGQSAATNVYDKSLFIILGMAYGFGPSIVDPSASASMLSVGYRYLGRSSRIPIKSEDVSIKKFLLSEGLKSVKK